MTKRKPKPPFKPGKAVCPYCNISIPIGSKRVLVDHNVLRPEGWTQCTGSNYRVVEEK